MSELPSLRAEIPIGLWKAYRADLCQLATAIRTETGPEALRRVCHKLGGAAGVYGLPDLRAAAVALEHCARPVDDGPLQTRLLETIERTIGAIDRLD